CQPERLQLIFQIELDADAVQQERSLPQPRRGHATRNEHATRDTQWGGCLSSRVACCVPRVHCVCRRPAASYDSTVTWSVVVCGACHGSPVTTSMIARPGRRARKNTAFGAPIGDRISPLSPSTPGRNGPRISTTSAPDWTWPPLAANQSKSPTPIVTLGGSACASGISISRPIPFEPHEPPSRPRPLVGPERVRPPPLPRP